MRTSMHRRSCIPSKTESFITEYLDFLVVLQSRASQSVVDLLCLCVQLLKASRGGITLFWLTNLRGTANIVSVVLVVSFTTIVVSKKSGTSLGRSMWVSVSFSALSTTQWTGVLLAILQVSCRKFHMDNIIRKIVTLVSLLSLNNSFGDLLTTKLSRTFLRALVWSVSSKNWPSFVRVIRRWHLEQLLLTLSCV